MVFSVISSVLPPVCCSLTRVVTSFLNIPSMYLIYMARASYSSLLCILRTCVDAGPFPASFSASTRLVWYLMLRASDFVSVFHPEYDNQSPVIISVSLTLYVTCGNRHCSWVSCRTL